MSRRKEPLARITITLPAALVRRADAHAGKGGHSRSRVLADALRSYLERPPEPAVREAVVPYSPGLGEQRLTQLKFDLALTPTERVREAEASTDFALQHHRVPRVPQVLAFETYEDYLAWKRRAALLW